MRIILEVLYFIIVSAVVYQLLEAGLGFLPVILVAILARMIWINGMNKE